jgi:acyl-CoA synthetase (NDP forming)/RimJ/RimL family protein N-acetyltransferase
MTGYPAHWEADVVLADGGTAHLRPIVPDDAERWDRFIAGLSPQTIYFRFFTESPVLGPAQREHFTVVDYVERVAFVALLGDEIVAIGRYDQVPGTPIAEVAFVVDDTQHGRGLGSILLEHLAAAARERGLGRFEAEVLTANIKMIRVFQDAGYRIEREVDGDSMRLAFDIEPTEHSVEVMRAREHRAESRSIARLLNPRTVAVVGASRTPGAAGHTVLRNILRGRFPGPVYPVNPQASAVASVRAYPTVLDIPNDVDLAVVVTPVGALDEVVAQCGARHVNGLVVITDPEDLSVDVDLAAQARAYGMRVVGPSSLGLISTQLGLNASLSPILPPIGGVGFYSQSGPLGAALLDHAARRGLGVSTFVSAGRRADVSSNALLQFWEEDEATDVVVLYLESVGNPRKFARLARRISLRKPVVALMTMATDVEAELLRQAGVIRVSTVTELFDVAQLLASQPLPAGRRLAVVANTVTLAQLAVSAATALGLSCAEPFMLRHGCSAREYGEAVEQAARDADAVLAIVVPPVDVGGGKIDAAVEAAQGTGKPVLVAVLSFDGAVPPELGPIPSYPAPDSAVQALSRAVEYAEFCARPVGLFAMPPPVDAAAARAALSEQRISDLLAVYGITVDPALSVHSADEALEAARQLGWPVALKSATRLHHRQQELAGVRLELADEDQLRAAFDTARLTEPELVVQRVAPPGVAVTVGAVEDPTFGPLVSFGVAGVATDLLGDRAYRILPLSDLDAAELVRSVRAAPLLFGYGGTAPVDVEALEQLLLKVGRMADELADIAGPGIPPGAHLHALELNPVIVGSSGLRILAAQARLGRPVPRADMGPRRIR